MIRKTALTNIAIYIASLIPLTYLFLLVKSGKYLFQQINLVALVASFALAVTPAVIGLRNNKDTRLLNYLAVMFVLLLTVIAVLSNIDYLPIGKAKLFYIAYLLTLASLGFLLLNKLLVNKEWVAASNNFLNFLVTLLLTAFIITIANPLLLFAFGDEYNIKPSLFLVTLTALFIVIVVIALFIYFISINSVRLVLQAIALFGLLLFSAYSFILPLNVGEMSYFILNDPSMLKLSSAKLATDLFLIVVLAGASWFTIFKKAATNKAANILVVAIVLPVLVINFNSIKSSLINKEDEVIVISEGFDVQLEKEISTTLNFSQDKNILVIILDGFSSGDIPHIFNNTASLNSIYSGFTWYPNSLSSGSRTDASHISMFGGHDYTIEKINARASLGKTVREERQEAYNNFYDMAGDDWEVLYWNAKYRNTLPINESIANTSFSYRDYYFKHNPLNALTNYHYEAFVTTLVSVFKSAPFFLKSTIYNEGVWLGANSDKFNMMTAVNYKAAHVGMLNALTSESKASKQKPDLKYLWFQIPHSPVTIGENGKLGQSSSVFIESEQAFIKISKVVERLKFLDVYDNTKIIIASDHGWWDQNILEFSDDFNKVINSGIEKRMNPSMINSLLMVKDFNAKGNFKTSNAFVSNSDIPSIVCTGIGSNCSLEDIDPTTNNIPNRKLITSSINTKPTDGKAWDDRVGFEVTDQYEVQENMFNLDNWKMIKEY